MSYVVEKLLNDFSSEISFTYERVQLMFYWSSKAGDINWQFYVRMDRTFAQADLIPHRWKSHVVAQIFIELNTKSSWQAYNYNLYDIQVELRG